MSKRDYLRVWDLSKTETEQILERARQHKTQRGRPGDEKPLQGKNIGLIFEKASTRTKVSFVVGINDLGGFPISLNSRDIQLSRGESVSDTARVLARYLDGVVIRTFEHERLKAFASHSSISVINGLTDLHHPCQALSDIMTVLENHSTPGETKISYVGDGNNVAHSLIEVCHLLGFPLTLACPEGHEPSPVLMEKVDGSTISVVRKPEDAVKDAAVIYTDVWTSMGQESEKEARRKTFAPYQVNAELVFRARPDAIVLHCLPAHRGEEITDEIIDGPRSRVFEQAENRLHAQKALMEFLLKSDEKA